MQRYAAIIFERPPQAATAGVACLLALYALTAVALPPLPAALAMIVYLAGFWLVFNRAQDAGLATHFGAANSVTLFRLALGCVLAGALLDETGGMIETGLVSGLALAVLALDGVDGWLARRSGTETAFGARFDMEVMLLSSRC